MDVKAVERPCGKERIDPGGQGGGPGGPGSPEVLATRDRMAESPLAGVVVERDFGTVEEAGESVPVGEETLHRLETGRGKGGGESVLLGLPLHECEKADESGAVLDPVLGSFPETVEGSDAANPGGHPGFRPARLDKGLDEVSPGMGPAEGERESGDAGGGIFVGRVAVDDEGAHRLGKVGERHLGGSGGIDDVHDRLDRQDDPEPPAMGEFLAAAVLPLRVAVDIEARLVGLREGGAPAFLHDPVVEGFEENGDRLESVRDCALGQRESLVFQILEKPERGAIVEELVGEDRDPEGDPELASRDETRSGRDDRDPGGAGAGACLSGAVATESAPVRPDGDLEDVGLLRRAVEDKGCLTVGTSVEVGTENLDNGRKVGVAGPSRALVPGLLSSLPLRPLFGVGEIHQLFHLEGGRRRFRIGCPGRLGGKILGRAQQSLLGFSSEQFLLQELNLPAQFGDRLLVFSVALFELGKGRKGSFGKGQGSVGTGAAGRRGERVPLLRRERFGRTGMGSVGENPCRYHAPRCTTNRFPCPVPFFLERRDLWL